MLAAVSELGASWFENSKWRAIFKPFVMLTLLACYLSAARSVRPLFAAGIALCLIGDVLLIFKRTFYIGGIAFFLAHVCFIFTFTRHVKLVAVWPAVLLASLYAATVIVISYKIRSDKNRFSRGMSTAYLVFVCVMSFTAFLQLQSIDSHAALLVFVGSSSFVASDSALLVREFQSDITVPKMCFIVMLTYIAALVFMVYGMIKI